ncbi:MAG: M1 family metallopeptidase [Candidatus Heimdallarchaeota archaeon]
MKIKGKFRKNSLFASNVGVFLIGMAIFALIAVQLISMSLTYDNIDIDDDNSTYVSGIAGPTPPSRIETPEYFVNATLNPNLHSITATMRLKLPVGYATVSLSELYLNIWPNAYSGGSTVIHAVQDENGVPLTWSITGSDRTKLRIELPAAITPDQEAWFVINFTDVIPNAASRYGWWDMSDNADAWYQHNAGNWLPMLAVHDMETDGWVLHPHPIETFGEAAFSRTSYFAVNITVPADTTVAASGTLLAKLELPSGWTMWRLQAETTPDFVFSAAKNLAAYSVFTASGVNVTSYYWDLDDNHKTLGIEAALIASKSVDLFSKLFAPYPYSSFKIVAAPLDVGGVEFPDLALISSGLYRNLNSLKGLEEVVSHEVGHSWFGFLSANDPYEEPWLDEAWAMFCTQLYLELVVGEGAIDYLSKNRLYFMAEPINPSFAILNRSMEYWEENFGYYGLIIYNKGLLVVNMFRYQVGNDTFFEIMQEYFKQFGFKNPRIRDLITIVNEVTGKSWDGFFNTFLNSPAVVPFRGNAAWLEIPGWGHFVLMIWISQDEDQFIPIRMPIRVTFSDGSTIDEFKWINDANATVDLIVDRLDIQEVRLDPDWAILDDLPSGMNRIIPFGDTPGTTSTHPTTPTTPTIPPTQTGTGTKSQATHETSNTGFTLPLLFIMLICVAVFRGIRRKRV